MIKKLTMEEILLEVKKLNTWLRNYNRHSSQWKPFSECNTEYQEFMSQYMIRIILTKEPDKYTNHLHGNTIRREFRKWKGINNTKTIQRYIPTHSEETLNWLNNKPKNGEVYIKGNNKKNTNNDEIGGYFYGNR